MEQGNLFITPSTPSKESTTSSQPDYNQRYLKAYQGLNPEQKKAVDTIEGPVLVAAGPGTGKTQILAMRVGKILLEQDVAPHNILCLTFTEAGVVAMRSRLLQLIGPTAHQVHINSFHGFCNQVIQENLDIFGAYKQFQPITELETIDVYRELIEQLPEDNLLKRYKYDKYTDLNRIKHLYDLMKKENLTPEDINKEVDEFLAKQDYTYKKKTYVKAKDKTFDKGDLKKDKIDADQYKYGKVKDAASQFPVFEKIMLDAERYDYSDMILWVIKEFEKNEQLISDYRERYLYFLIDEYQDTNGSQNKLIDFLLGDYEKPNVFVVGDDDQAIFKFQGANLGNIKDFKKNYAPELVVLKSNYRSTQPILDASGALITHNEERLLDKMPGLTKDLQAAGINKELKNPPRILNFTTTSEEHAFLIKELKEIYDNNPERLCKVAVVYRAHRQAADLVTVLEQLDIPLNIKRRVNILNLPLVSNLMEILSYLVEELNRNGSGQHRLYQILHYKYFGIESLDLDKIAHHLTLLPKDEKITWRQLISDSSTLDTLALVNPEAIKQAAAKLNHWLTEVSSLTLQRTFELIINEGGILDMIISGNNRAWDLQVLSTFFDFIKTETAKNPDMKLIRLVHMIKKMKEEYIELPVNKFTSSEDGVHFLTAHAAKGLEFEQVYIIGCNKNNWDRKFGGFGQFSYPDTINADSASNIEDERRLFYVAMTRAEKNLTMTFSDRSDNDKKLSESQFLSEITSQSTLQKEEQMVNSEDVLTFHYNILKRKQVTMPLIDKNLIDAWLKGYKLSVTHLNKFLRCPLTFYFEAILRVPGARNAATGFGSAMHDTLDAFFQNIRGEKTQSAEWLQFLYKEKLAYYRSHFTDKEYIDYLAYGLKVLTGLHKEKMEDWLAIPDYKLEVKLNNAAYKGVPLKGVIDKVEIFKDHINVVDYKTGSFKTDKLKSSSADAKGIGGDYWRQIVFYKMLLDSDNKYNWTMSSGRIDYLEPDKYKKNAFITKSVNVTAEDIQEVGKQIENMYAAINKYEFDKTCEDEKCRWCNFTSEHYKTRPQELKPGQVFDVS